MSSDPPEAQNGSLYQTETNNTGTEMEGKKGKSDVQSPRLRTPYLGGKKRKDSDMRNYGLLTPSG